MAIFIGSKQVPYLYRTSARLDAEPALFLFPSMSWMSVHLGRVNGLLGRRLPGYEFKDLGVRVVRAALWIRGGEGWCVLPPRSPQVTAVLPDARQSAG